VTPDARMAFANGTTFVVQGVPLARDCSVVGLGIDLNITPTAVLSLSYNAKLASGFTDHTVKGDFNIKF
jgi:outer membrane autotransporter protein